MRRCVWSRNLKNEQAMTRVGSQRHSKKKKKYYNTIVLQLPAVIQYSDTLYWFVAYEQWAIPYILSA
jgi:hypothetical protein